MEERMSKGRVTWKVNRRGQSVHLSFWEELDGKLVEYSAVVMPVKDVWVREGFFDVFLFDQLDMED